MFLFLIPEIKMCLNRSENKDRLRSLRDLHELIVIRTGAKFKYRQRKNNDEEFIVRFLVLRTFADRQTRKHTRCTRKYVLLSRICDAFGRFRDRFSFLFAV